VSVSRLPERTEVWLPNALMAARHLPGSQPDLPRAVYLHGLGGSSLNWYDLMVALGDHVEGWALDLGGFGDSPPPRDGNFSPAGYARSVASFIEHLDAGPVHVFGNSLGGAVALQLAGRYPSLVRSLTMISPALPALRPRRATMHLPVIAIPGVGEPLVRKYTNEVSAHVRVQAMIDACFADPARVSDDRRAAAVDETASRDHLTYGPDALLRSLRGLLRTFVDVGPERPWRLAEQVACPTLAIYGRKDQLVDPKAAHRITKHFCDATVVVLADCGHVAQMEHPDEVAATWLAVVGSHSRVQAPAHSLR
jgi:pimeloyl-ACP methyl ester carboxylesterase